MRGAQKKTVLGPVGYSIEKHRYSQLMGPRVRTSLGRRTSWMVHERLKFGGRCTCCCSGHFGIKEDGRCVDVKVEGSKGCAHFRAQRILECGRTSFVRLYNLIRKFKVQHVEFNTCDPIPTFQTVQYKLRYPKRTYLKLKIHRYRSNLDHLHIRSTQLYHQSHHQTYFDVTVIETSFARDRPEVNIGRDCGVGGGDGGDDDDDDGDDLPTVGV
jgi:hypothetical protein